MRRLVADLEPFGHNVVMIRNVCDRCAHKVAGGSTWPLNMGNEVLEVPVLLLPQEGPADGRPCHVCHTVIGAP